MQSKINVELLNNYRKENNLSVNAFCKQCKISQEVYNKIINNQTNYRITALWKLARVLGIAIKDLFVQEENIEETSSNICEI